VNLKVMSLLPGFRYSSVAATDLTGQVTDKRLTVDASQQIPRRPAGVSLRRGLAFSGGLRLAL